MAYKNMKEFKRDWLKALRSGEYIQGTHRLCREDFRSGEYEFCALGVAADLLVLAGHRVAWSEDGWFTTKDGIGGSRNTISQTAPAFLRDWLNVSTDPDDYETREYNIMKLNDNGGNFCTVADVIEKM